MRRCCRHVIVRQSCDLVWRYLDAKFRVKRVGSCGICNAGLRGSVVMSEAYRGADKSLPDPTEKKNNSKIAIFRPTRRSLLPRRPGWTDNLTFFWSGLQKVEFGRCTCFLPGGG